jgi:hypothetical protein
VFGDIGMMLRENEGDVDRSPDEPPDAQLPTSSWRCHRKLFITISLYMYVSTSRHRSSTRAGFAEKKPKAVRSKEVSR